MILQKEFRPIACSIRDCLLDPRSRKLCLGLNWKSWLDRRTERVEAKATPPSKERQHLAFQNRVPLNVKWRYMGVVPVGAGVPWHFRILADQ